MDKEKLDNFIAKMTRPRREERPPQRIQVTVNIQTGERVIMKSKGPDGNPTGLDFKEEVRKFKIRQRKRKPKVITNEDEA